MSTERAVEAFREAHKATKARPNMTDWDATEAGLRAALPHLQPQASPPAPDVAGEDAEVERVKRAIFNAANGQQDWLQARLQAHTESAAQFLERKCEDLARAAIRAIREGGQRWGVWFKRDGARIGALNGIPLGPTTDKEYLLSVFQAMRIGEDYEVRPYPGEREEGDIGKRIAKRVAASVSPQTVIELADEINAAIRDAKENTNG